jgi:hypothetical protein
MIANTKWKLAIVIAVVLCIAATPIVPTASAQIPPTAPPVAGPGDSPQQSPHKSGKKKWIVILAVAAGVVVAVILTSQKKDTAPAPIITVGPPTVG